MDAEHDPQRQTNQQNDHQACEHERNHVLALGLGGVAVNLARGGFSLGQSVSLLVKTLAVTAVCFYAVCREFERVDDRVRGRVR